MSEPGAETALRTLAAAEPGFGKPLPGADLVWQRAAARARWRQYERATRSIRIAELAAAAVCAGVGLAAFALLAPAFERLHPAIIEASLAALVVAAASGWALVRAFAGE